ncbi:MAG: ATP-binding cassette domain-containing protein, partial [Deferribacterota bacterium]|nr:ATP-binding cassette domain-containing protein [Deferribacterota bacterium]
RLNDDIYFDSNKKINTSIRKRGSSYLPQEYILFPHMNVLENISYGLKFAKKKIDSKLIYEIADKIGIVEKLNSAINTLSGGQKQRVALARILVLRPLILLLDEPFSALDTTTGETLLELISDITDELALTTIFITHNLSDAYIFAEDLILIKDGEVLEYGNKNILYNKPKKTESARMIDFKNIWNIKDISYNTVITDFGHKFTYINSNRANNATHICIRPENIMIIRPDLDIKSSLKENIVQCKIKKIKIAGKDCYLDVLSAKGLELKISLPNHAFEKMNLKVETDIYVSLKKQSIILTNG